MSDDATPEPDWMRKRRLAEIFGDVEPAVTRDEKQEPGEAGESRGAGAPGESASDRWLKSQVPPHHGG